MLKNNVLPRRMPAYASVCMYVCMTYVSGALDDVIKRMPLWVRLKCHLSSVSGVCIPKIVDVYVISKCPDRISTYSSPFTFWKEIDLPACR